MSQYTTLAVLDLAAALNGYVAAIEAGLPLLFVLGVLGVLIVLGIRVAMR